MSSNKLQVVDERTFARYRNGLSERNRVPKINNSLYKRLTANTLNLLNYAKRVKYVRSCLRKKMRLPNPRRPAGGRNPHRLVIYGRQRNKAMKKHLRTKMKKRIMAWRQQKQLKRNLEINDIVGDLSRLCLKSSDVSMTSEPENRMEVDTVEEPQCSCSQTVPVRRKPLHSRRFRSYCENCTTETLCNLTKELLKQLNHFQHRSFLYNPIRAAAHRRYVLGFREVNNLLYINKIKMIIMATDCEECNLEGGPDETIANMKRACERLEVPIVYALQRRQLAYALFKSASISCVGILNFDGAIDTYNRLMIALSEARESYQQLKQLYN